MSELTRNLALAHLVQLSEKDESRLPSLCCMMMCEGFEVAMWRFVC